MYGCTSVDDVHVCVCAVSPILPRRRLKSSGEGTTPPLRSGMAYASIVLYAERCLINTCAALIETAWARLCTYFIWKVESAHRDTRARARPRGGGRTCSHGYSRIIFVPRDHALASWALASIIWSKPYSENRSIRSPRGHYMAEIYALREWEARCQRPTARLTFLS